MDCPARCRRCWDMIRSAGICSSSVVGAASTRHSTYRLRHATIVYRWHPLFGRTLQVSPHRRGKELTCIYTDERPGLSRELPNWMFDQSYCAGMTIGAPQIGLEGLVELSAVLSLLGTTQDNSTRSRSLRKKEMGSAKTSMSRSGPVCSRPGAPGSAVPGDPDKPSRTCGGVGRSPVGGTRRPADSSGGRQR